MTELKADSQSNLTTKPTVNYIGELGQHGEFEGGLMESWEYNPCEPTIITSKEDVYKHIISKQKSKSIQKPDDKINTACQQCIICWPANSNNKQT